MENLREPHACQNCGKWIEKPNQRGRPQRFCSKACGAGVHAGLRTYTCQVCGRKWESKSVPGHPPAYCSEECRKDAAKARASEWYYANPERVAEQPSQQPDHRAKVWAAYYAANRERLIERSLQYFRDNPEGKRARDAARYAMTRGAAEAEKFSLDEIYTRDRGICYLCGQPCPESQRTMDHVIPVVLGGPHTRANVKLACRSCNSRKRHNLLDPDDPRLNTNESEKSP